MGIEMSRTSSPRGVRWLADAIEPLLEVLPRVEMERGVEGTEDERESLSELHPSHVTDTRRDPRSAAPRADARGARAGRRAWRATDRSP